MKLKQLFGKRLKNVNREDTKRFIEEEKMLLLALLKTMFQKRSWGTKTYENTMLNSQTKSDPAQYELKEFTTSTK